MTQYEVSFVGNPTVGTPVSYVLDGRQQQGGVVVSVEALADAPGRLNVFTDTGDQFTGPVLQAAQPAPAAPLYAVPPPDYNAQPRKSGSGAWIIGVIAVMGCGLFGIAILAAILFPVFAKARERARQTTCQSNLKQIGMALVMYAEDNNGVLPSSSGKVPSEDYCTGSNTSASTYVTFLNPYVHSKELFYCPSDTPEANGRVSYYYRTCIDRIASRGAVASDFKFPAQSMTIVERLGFHSGDKGAGWANGVKLNTAFMDGHVKYCRPAPDTASGARSEDILAGSPAAMSAPGWPMFFNYYADKGIAVRGTGTDQKKLRDEVD